MREPLGIVLGVAGLAGFLAAAWKYFIWCSSAKLTLVIWDCYT